MPRPRAQALCLGALLLLALALRLPALDRLPTPCGDEGNWAWYGRELAAGRPVALDPDARFVTLAFAHLIAAFMRALGPTFAAARAPLVVGAALAMVGAFALGRALRRPGAGLAVAALLAVHPWSVMASRNATAPYALALGTMVCAPLAWLYAHRQGRPWTWILAGALLGAGLHASPLAALTALTCAAWTLSAPAPRAALRTRGPWLALLTAAVVALPVMRGALAVARAGSTRPRHLFTHLGDRLYVYVRTLLGSLSGESTLRHFVAPRTSLALEFTAAAGCAALLVLAARTRDDDDDLTRDLARLTRLAAAVTLVGTAALLAPARPWNLPAIDAERYGFAPLAAFALALATLATRRRTRAAPWAFAAVMLAGPTRATLTALHHGAGADHGFWTLAHGGGYRGWKTPREPVALPTLIAREVNALRGGSPATVVVADYAFHTLPVSTGDAPVETVDVAKAPLPTAPGRLHVFVRWSDGLFAPAYLPRDDVAAQNALTALMQGPRFRDLHRVRVVPQRDGAALVELWAATHAP
jgi:hypothetical protein